MEPAPSSRAPWLRTAVRLAVAALAGVILAAIFFAYQRPAFLMELLNLRYCG